MAKFHFFTEVNLFSQSTNQGYGPVIGSETTQYRVTSKFTVSNDAKAFAVCDGIVFVQAVTGSTTLVNLILKPTGNIETGFTPVEYFIYRGLKKENFVDSSGALVAESALNSTDLTDGIWDYASAFIPPDPDIVASEKAFGWDKNSLPPVILLNEIFNSVDNNTQLHHVKQGEFIGRFAAGNTVGFEIVLKDRMFLLDLGMARAPENIITVSAPGGSEIPGNEPIARMREREKILNFVDPAAYLMLFYERGIHYRNSDNTFDDVFGYADIYADIVSKFETKNTLYIDIRNENGYSLNYYKDNEGATGDSDYGKHLQISFDGINFTPVEYYKDYWPIYSISQTNLSVNPSQEVSLKIRQLYNSSPYVYFDFAMEGSSDALLPVIGQSKFLGVSSSTSGAWSGPSSFDIPIITDTVSFITKIYVGKHSYAGTMPSSSLVRQHYLDYIFGPVALVSSIPPPTGTEWKTVLGKKLVSAAFPLGFNAAVEIVLTESPSFVQFSANVVDMRYATFTTAPERILNSNNLELANDIPFSSMGRSPLLDSTYDSERMSVNTESKFIPGLNTHLITYSFPDDSNYKPELFCLTVTRTEFDTYIRPAISNVDEDLHDATLNIYGISGNPGNTQAVLPQVVDTVSGITFYEGIVKIHGLDSNGNHAIDNTLQSVEIVTLDGRFFQSLPINLTDLENATDSNAYSEIDDVIQYIQTVEECYYNLPSNFPMDVPDSSLEQTTTRIRVHYYGSHARRRKPLFSIDGGKEELALQAFQNLIANAQYHGIYRRLHPLTLKNLMREKGENAYKHLTAEADENSFQDNPSPYIIVNKASQPYPANYYHADLGQIFYGFESLHLNVMGSGYNGYSDYPLYNNTANHSVLPFTPVNATDIIELVSFDFSGLIANISTPAAEYFYHLKKNRSHLTGVSVPVNPDLDYYYNVSAPDADLIGNADALGIYKAYLNLITNLPNLKLSDIFKLYYRGEHVGLTLGSEPYYQSVHRWKIMALHIKFLEQVGNNFSWRPDVNDSTWTMIKSKFLNTMWLFAEFWYNTLGDAEQLWSAEAETGLRVSLNMQLRIHRFITDNSWIDNIDVPFHIDDYNGVNILPQNGTAEKITIKNALSYCLDNKFIPFLKSKLQEEGVPI